MVNAITTFFFYAVVAVAAQNAVLARGLGISRLVRLSTDESTNTMLVGGSLMAIEVVAGTLAYYANRFLLSQVSWRNYARPLVLTLCVTVAMLLALAVCYFGYQKNKLFAKVTAVLPLATFNTTVLGALLITSLQSYSLTQTIAFSLGTGVGYLLAVLVVTEGQRRINTPAVPRAFRGLPATLVYIGVLAMAIYAFTGHMVLI